MGTSMAWTKLGLDQFHDSVCGASSRCGRVLERCARTPGLVQRARPGTPRARKRFLRGTAGYLSRMSTGWRWLLLVVFVVWTVLAFQWMDIGCDYPEAYLAVIRFGTPEGLEFIPACAG